MKNKLFIILLLAVTVIFFLFYLNSSTKKSYNTFNDALPQAISTLDPGMVKDIYSSQVASQIFECLVKFSSKKKIEPSLATQWKIKDDEIIFDLRKNVYFFDPGDKENRDEFFAKCLCRM